MTASHTNMAAAPQSHRLVCVNRALAAVVISVAALLCTAAAAPWAIDSNEQCFTVYVREIQVLQHCQSSPMLFIGDGQTRFVEHHGNFHIDDYVSQRIPLANFTFENDTVVTFSSGNMISVTVFFETSLNEELLLRFSEMPAGMNRAWLRIFGERSEMVFGGGEQYSHFNLRGRTYPVWTREQGVGRNKKTLVTFISDVSGPDAGGDYHTTYLPQPTFVSSRRYYCHSDSYAYSELDFTHSEYHELETHGPLSPVYFGSAGNMADLVTQIAGRFGRQPMLPEWLLNGAVLGLQGGTEVMLQRLDEAENHGVKITAVWIQDWVGRLVTSFGSRLFWNWVWDEKLYPNLDVLIKTLASKNIRVMAYINPHLNVNGTLFKIADTNGYLVRSEQGGSYISDFGEFYCGTIDLTNPAAVGWYKDIIKKNMIEFGFSGWMADFGEYLPSSGVVYYDGSSAADVMHNKFPVLWAQANREAVEEAGALGSVCFFMRSGFAGTQNYSTLMWAGDQNVDFSLDDGLPSTIPAALSLGLSGFTMTHFDIGGYTSLPSTDVVRTKELLLRSAEAAVFTPVMRTHEGNRPNTSWQVYSDDDTWQRFAKLTDQFAALLPYRRAVLQEAATLGLPAQRPLFLHYERDARTYDAPYEYMLGRDLLVAPVVQANRTTWSAYLPADDWTHVWSCTRYEGPLDVTVDAPLGLAPAFFRSNSSWAEVFRQLGGCERQRAEL